MLLNQKGGYEQRPENTNTKSGQAKGGRVPLARGRDHAGGAIGPFYLDDSLLSPQGRYSLGVCVHILGNLPGDKSLVIYHHEHLRTSP